MMNFQLVVTFRDLAAGSQGSMSPESRYQYAFVRCVAAVGVVDETSLGIKAIIIVFARLRDCDAIDSDVTLTET